MSLKYPKQLIKTNYFLSFFLSLSLKSDGEIIIFKKKIISAITAEGRSTSAQAIICITGTQQPHCSAQ